MNYTIQIDREKENLRSSFLSTLFSEVLHVSSKLIEEMINDFSCEDTKQSATPSFFLPLLLTNIEPGINMDVDIDINIILD